MTRARRPWVEPDTAALLAAMATDFAGAPAEPTVDERRQGLNIAAGLYGPAPAPVGRVEERVAPGPRGPVPLRVYWPPRAERDRLRPLVVHIHGGGWVLGDPDGYERVCRAYCAAGDCVVVDVDYRRAPEHKHPAALDDCLAALAWAAANARALGGDPMRLVVTGDSAGGHLAAATCQQTSIPVALQILVYPVTTASAHAGFASRKTLGDGTWFLREFDILRAESEYFPPDADREAAPASPLLAPAEVLSRQPPTVVITASLDPLCDEGAAYVKALKRAGAVAREWRIKGTIHGFVLFAGRIGKGRDVIRRIGRAVSGARFRPPRPGRIRN
ncbi:MAG: alpha/beta hydrolase [Brevundimonas sp.]|jgi:acetyl esterase|uniref:alpha/beta hydrolase n=1 Tax=Brevundimonas sp. TaxID=1871086 RepID=UPI0017FE4EEC|nr:alpha/beta hydrolase [Brevundimonas sp.]MBA4803206.1 alpha/beta hydrolase [Brevundimonas sp.]